MEKRALVSVSATQIAVVPDRMTVRMKYVTYVDLDTSSTGRKSNIFRLNSIYDPDQTGGGGQPTGHDQWAYFYSKYRVHQCTVKAYCVAATVAHTIAVGPTNSTASSTYIGDRAEDPRALTGMANSGGPEKNFNQTFDMRALFGVSKELFGQDEYGAAFSTNPASTYYYEIVAFNMLGMSTGHVYATIELEYIVELYERNDLAPSLKLMADHHPQGCRCVSCTSKTSKV